MNSGVRTASYLTADIGNSAIKLALWIRDRSDRACLDARLEVAHDRLEDVRAWVKERARPVGAAAACVASSRSRLSLAEVLAAFVDLPPRAPAPTGLSIECRVPDAVGEDRVFAALGALCLVGAPAVVVDAGTALTVDALARAEHAGGGRFLGGAIAPGPELLARALADETARLPHVVPMPDPPALGRDTRAAILSGVGVGFAGAARELVRAVAREAGIEGAPIVLTGGARAFLLGAFAQHPPRVVPDLVHIGLLTAGTAALGSPWRVRQEG